MLWGPPVAKAAVIEVEMTKGTLESELPERTESLERSSTRGGGTTTMRLSFSHLAVLTHLSAVQQMHEDKAEREVSPLYDGFHIN